MKKFAELKDLTVDEIETQISTLSRELFEHRFKKAINQLEDTNVFRRKKHLIAQLKTVLRQKELATQGGHHA